MITKAWYGPRALSHCPQVPGAFRKLLQCREILGAVPGTMCRVGVDPANRVLSCSARATVGHEKRASPLEVGAN